MARSSDTKLYSLGCTSVCMASRKDRRAREGVGREQSDHKDLCNAFRPVQVFDFGSRFQRFVDGVNGLRIDAVSPTAKHRTDESKSSFERDVPHAFGFVFLISHDAAMCSCRDAE